MKTLLHFCLLISLIIFSNLSLAQQPQDQKKEMIQEKESIKPLIYEFKTDYLYFPILISGISEISESRTEINLWRSRCS